MALHTLQKITTKAKKRLGRGYGSGKGGHTSSRGQKGQKTRDTVKLLFEGTKTNKDFFRRTPMLRGKGKLKSHKTGPVLIKSSQLTVFTEGAVVDLNALVKLGLVNEIDAKAFGVKILFDKAINIKLELKVPASAAVLKNVKA